MTDEQVGVWRTQSFAPGLAVASPKGDRRADYEEVSTDKYPLKGSGGAVT